MKKKVLIIDDEPLARSIVKNYLASHAQLEVVDECDNGFEGLKAIQQHQPDLLILDIQMPKINGFEMLELLDKMPSVIFATAFDEFAIKAFEKNAVDYLLKPFSAERFDAAITKWLQTADAGLGQRIADVILEEKRQDEKLHHIVTRNQGEVHIIPLHDIQYIEAFDDYVKIFTAESYFLKKQTMAFYEANLDNNKFFRLHRSYIVQLSELTRLESMEKNSYIAVLKSGKKIPVSRTSYQELKAKLKF